jgi:hypothetical protein
MYHQVLRQTFLSLKSDCACFMLFLKETKIIIVIIYNFKRVFFETHRQVIYFEVGKKNLCVL